MTVRLITLSLRQVLRLLLLACRSSRSKNLELLVLRQELAVLRRQVPHPKTKREERLVLTVLQRLRPVHERLSSLFTPDTLRRWHRELVLPAGLDENGSASFAEDASAYLHADAKRRRLMTAVTDRRAPKCFLWSCG